jgi:hypothetical protein
MRQDCYSGMLTCLSGYSLPFCRAFEAQEWQEAEEAYLAALAVDPAHKLINRELHLQLCKLRQMLSKPQEALEVGWTCSSFSCVHTPFVQR